MKKTYWWRIVFCCFSGVIVILGLLYDSLICFPGGRGECIFSQFRLSIIYPVILLVRSLLLVSPFLFFVRDEVFKKWLWFALVWFGTANFFIAITPEYHAGIFEMMNPTKETVSMFFGILFVPISLGKLAWDSRRTA